jgi:hypothetical protein
MRLQPSGSRHRALDYDANRVEQEQLHPCGSPCSSHVRIRIGHEYTTAAVSNWERWVLWIVVA